MAARVARFVYQEGYREHFERLLNMYSTRTYPNGRVIGYSACLIRDARRVLNRGERIKKRNTEFRRDNKRECLCARPSKHSRCPPMTDSNRLGWTYLGEVPEYGHVVFEASEERPFHAVDGDEAHVCSSFVEPCAD